MKRRILHRPWLIWLRVLKLVRLAAGFFGIARWFGATFNAQFCITCREAFLHRVCVHPQGAGFAAVVQGDGFQERAHYNVLGPGFHEAFHVFCLKDKFEAVVHESWIEVVIKFLRTKMLDTGVLVKIIFTLYPTVKKRWAKP